MSSSDVIPANFDAMDAMVGGWLRQAGLEATRYARREVLWRPQQSWRVLANGKVYELTLGEKS
jgi:hypothetical protein